MKHTLHAFLPGLLAFALLTGGACRAEAQDQATESETTIVFLEDGSKLFTIGSTAHEGDEYISPDNTLYRITQVGEGKAAAVRIGQEPMPDVSWLETGEVQSVFSANEQNSGKYTEKNPKLIAMYVTHSDESYVPSDGTQSIEGQGGIYDVARSFRDALQALGIDVILDESTHLPHDAGAYRRSRQTAQRLLKHAPDAIIDVHRDGIPDESEYAVKLDGENASQVRLLVGRANQNSSVNREFAKQIKAVGDHQYPGLIKDIFIGKGTYNQDLSPNAILLEFGTHTISKDRVLNSVDNMAHVVSTALYGTQSGSAPSKESAAVEKEREKGAPRGIVWMVLLVVAGILIFAFVQTGSGRGMREKISRGASEISGGLFGKKPKDKEDND